jgi:hypothetical protein
MTRIGSFKLALETWGPFVVSVDERTQRLWGQVRHETLVSAIQRVGATRGTKKTRTKLSGPLRARP